MHNQCKDQIRNETKKKHPTVRKKTYVFASKKMSKMDPNSMKTDMKNDMKKNLLKK